MSILIAFQYLNMIDVAVDVVDDFDEVDTIFLLLSIAIVFECLDVNVEAPPPIAIIAI